MDEIREFWAEMSPGNRAMWLVEVNAFSTSLPKKEDIREVKPLITKRQWKKLREMIEEELGAL